MEPFQLIALKHAISTKLLEEALAEVAKIDTKKYRRVRVIFEFEMNERGDVSDSLEVRYRRPWK